MKEFINQLSKVGTGNGSLYVLIAIACFVVFLSVQTGLVTSINSVAGGLADKLDTMSIASGGSSAM